jgi:hypothetical protein
MQAVADAHHAQADLDDTHGGAGTDNPPSNLSMQGGAPSTPPCAWHELFVIGGKIPNRRAYHVSFVWNNE